MTSSTIDLRKKRKWLIDKSQYNLLLSEILHGFFINIFDALKKSEISSL